jgi:hypothetical protein
VTLECHDLRTFANRHRRKAVRCPQRDWCASLRGVHLLCYRLYTP